MRSKLTAYDIIIIKYLVYFFKIIKWIFSYNVSVLRLIECKRFMNGLDKKWYFFSTYQSRSCSKYSVMRLAYIRFIKFQL